ncbi:MAG: histidine kinase [Candidatus Azobacteroides sp.]|nr:histidine kinase [Candidatus Azobacteroides sp.]
MNNRILLFLLLFLVNISGFSQEPKKWVHSYTYRYLGVHDGLAQTQVFKSFQDSYGYLWFATNDGVSRFDGLRFDNFSPKDLHTNSRILYFNQYESAVYMASGNNIVFVYPDQTMAYYPFPDDYRIIYEGIATVGDNLYLFNCLPSAQRELINFTLLRFNLKTKTFTRLAENLPSLRCCIFGQKVYACKCYEIKGQQLTIYRIEGERLQTVQIVPMEKDDIDFRRTNRNEWFAILAKGTARYLYQCFIENDSLRWNNPMPIPDNELKCIEHWDEHRFLAGFVVPVDDPVFILDPSSRSLSSFPLNTLMVNDIMVDRDGNAWFSTEEGIYQCSRAFFESYRLGFAHNDNIWGVIKDSPGNVWFSSYTYGLWRADAQGGLHKAKTVYNGKNYTVNYGYMSNCTDDRERIFQTTVRGIAVFDPKYGDPDRLDIYPTGASLVVYHDPENGNIWFGGDTALYRTLNVLHPNGELSSYPFGSKHIISISRDGNRKLRLGTFQGEARFDEENQSVVFDTVQRPYTGLISMALDEDGILWKATTDGLFAEDRRGNDRKIAAGSMIDFVIRYKNQYIIWGVKNNLYVLDLPAYHRDSTVRIRTFGIYDGFDLLECGQNGASIDPEGYVWVAGSDKAIRFLPEQIMKIPMLQARAPYLAAIYTSDKNTEWSLTQANSSIELPNEENYLRFDVLQASATAPDQLIFRYKLNGYNDQWTTSRDRSLIFQNLPFGKFRLELQSSFDGGAQWSESVFSSQITIRKPFLLTFPGLALIFSGIAIATVFLIYYTRKISIRKGEEARKIDQMKHRAVQAKFIPHFTGNVLNSIGYLISKNPDSARKYISKFSDFSNLTLRNSDQLYRTIQEELDYSCLYLELEKLRFEEKLEYNVSVAPEADTQKMIPTMVLQTFCENAIKHGLRPKPEGGKIAIRVEREGDYVVLSVEDNGIGREQARMSKTEGTKEGLNIVQQQLDLFNKNQSKKAHLQIVDLQDEAGQPSGTRFELYVP